MDGKAFEAMGISDEAKARAMAATSAEELLALAHEEGVELTDEQLEGASGGWDNSKCGNNDGDARDDVDESFLSEAFRAGERLGDDA